MVGAWLEHVEDGAESIVKGLCAHDPGVVGANEGTLSKFTLWAI